MDIKEWINQITLDCKEKGIQITQEKKAFLSSEFPETFTPYQQQIVAEVSDVMTRSFFEKASRGEIFGHLDRIKERFGNTLEENYGILNGPFIDMAKTYWTYKIEVGDLFPNYHNRVLSKVLKEIESLVASVFFPTPGPHKIPSSQRSEKQKQILQEFAPDIDIERLLSDSPILKTEEGKRGCFGLILLFVLIPTAFLLAITFLL